MATTSRPESRSLEETGEAPEIMRALRETPWEFDFFQAVRLIERHGEGEPVAGWAHPEKEAIRFLVHNRLPFPASQIQGLDFNTGGPARMLVNFMGLTGPAGVLPTVYTELIIDRVRQKDRTLEAFLDIFHHRMVSLFYQAWEKHQFQFVYEQTRRDLLSKMLRSLIGMGFSGLANRLSVFDDSLLFYTGLLAPHPHSAAALESLLADYFQVPVKIEQFIGAWYPVERANQCALDQGLAWSEQLGQGAVVGDEMWDQQSKVRIRIGPLTLDEYLDFLPTGTAYQPLRSLTRYYTGNEIDCEAQLILKRDDVPGFELRDEEEPPLPLGWLTWVKSGTAFDRNAADTILQLSGVYEPN